VWWPYGAGDAVLTDAGRLVVRGSTGAAGGDGFVVIDVGRSVLEAPVSSPAGWVTGFALDGERLVFTFGRDGGLDREGRPRLRHDLVQVDLDTREATAPVNVPGYVVASREGLVFTAEETWGEGWSWRCSILACAVDAAGVTVVDRLALPEGAYDLRAADASLWYSTTAIDGGGGSGGGGGSVPPGGGPGIALPADPFVMPSTRIEQIHLGATLSRGPSIPSESGFRTLLLPEDRTALVVRDGLTVERWDARGADALLLWSAPVSGYALNARPDPSTPGTYLVPLGYGGVALLP
jgi:hypothetical protein